MKLIEANLPHIKGPLVIGVLASGTGSAMQALVRSIESGELNAQVAVVISNNSQSPALRFARDHNINAIHVSQVTEQTPEAADKKMREELAAAGVNLLILSGFMKQLGPETLTAYLDASLNLHPGDTKRYGGRGMYDRNVHAKVLEARDTYTLPTVHRVTGIIDGGPIVAQELVPVFPNDTIDTLRDRVMPAERRMIVEVAKAITSLTDPH